MYADLVTVAGFKPVVAAEKSPGGFDSLPLPFLFSRESSGCGEMRCLFVGSRGCYFEYLALVANSSMMACDTGGDIVSSGTHSMQMGWFQKCDSIGQ